MSDFKFNKLLLFSLLILYVYSYCSVPEGYYFNEKTKQYTELPTNCAYVDYYGTEYECSDCNSGFVLKDS